MQNTYIVDMMTTNPIILEWSFSYIKKLIEHCEKCEKTVNKPEVNREIRLSPNECHKIDTSSRVRKTVANASNDQEKMNNAFRYEDDQEKREKTLYEDDQEKNEKRFTKTGTTTRVRLGSDVVLFMCRT